MTEGKVSIVIPSYKGEDTIVDVVESALNQDYPDIEVIVVDDNGFGTEHQIATENKLSLYLDNPKFIYIKHDHNKNGSAARNTGVKASTGEFIAFLDDDDYYYPQKISKCVQALKKKDDSFGFVYTAYDLCYPGKRVDTVAPNESGDILESFMLAKIRLCSSSVMLRKKVVDEFNGFDETFNRHQDWEFLIRVMSKYKAEYIDEVLMKKNMLRRNSPAKPEIVEEYRLHFLVKIKPYVVNRDKTVVAKFFDRHYFDIAKAYFKNANFIKAFYWIRKTHKPVYYSVKIIPDSISYLLRSVLKEKV